MLDRVRARRDEIYGLAERHKAKQLWVFGSCSRKEERPDSDVDFLVKFDDGAGYDDYDAIEDGLSTLLGRKVQVVSSEALERSPCFAYNVRKDMVPL